MILTAIIIIFIIENVLNVNLSHVPKTSQTSHVTTSHVCFSLFIIRGHSTREPASSRVTCFILWAHTGIGVSQSQHRKNSGEVLEKNAGEWSERVEIRKEEIPGIKRSMYGYILTYSRR